MLDAHGRCELPKRAIHGFIDVLGKSKHTTHQHDVESYYGVVANELIHNDDNIHLQGMVKEHKLTTSANMFKFE